MWLPDFNVELAFQWRWIAKLKAFRALRGSLSCVAKKRSTTAEWLVK
jgi:hypothetical protein